MSDEWDDREMERRLRDDDAGPGPEVEAAVMRAYDDVYGRRRFWRRPVPLYQVAATLVLVAGLALAAGRMSGSRETASESAPGPVPAATDWTTAAPDILVTG